MSWSPLALSTPASSALAVNHNIGIFSVTPWTHGIREGQGSHTWLSFPNAVEAVVDEVDQLNSSAVLALAVAAANLKSLSDQIATLSTGFPVRELSQWQRHADYLSALEKDKFSLPDPAVTAFNRAVHGLPAVVEQAKKAISQQALADANGLLGQDPLTNLSAFEVDKIAHDAEVNTALPPLAGAAGWRFYAQADIATALRTGHPGHETTLTAILVFYGSVADLAYLKEMLP